MKKIVLTGATSSIGVALIETCLLNGVEEIVVLVRDNSKNLERIPKDKRIKFIYLDLSMLSEYIPQNSDYDCFFHLGWVNTAKECRNDAIKQSVNIGYAIEAVRLAKRFGCRKFIGAGSQAEYGIHQNKKTSIHDELKPFTAYGIAKCAAGKLCEIEAARNELEYSWVRIFSIYGKNDLQETMVKTTIDNLRNNVHCSFTLGTHYWDYLYAKDAGDAFYEIARASHSNKYYCLGSGEAKTIKEYVETIIDIVNPTAKAGFGEIPYPKEGPMSLCADISEIVADTGWMPKVSFADGIRSIISERSS